jgi:hypothetical protein
VADLRRGAGRAAVEVPAQHGAAAHAGADREHHEVRAREAPVLERLGERRARRVVVDEHRQAEALREQLAQRHVLERDVHARADAPGLEVDNGRHADADRAHVVVAMALDRLHELGDQRVAVVDLRLDERALGELAVGQGRRRDLGAPDVEADEPVAHSFDAAASSSSTVSAP